MYYLFDTNILLFYLRSNPVCQQIDLTYDPFGAANTAMLSAVSVGEIKSIAVQNDWGRAKWVRLRELMSLFVLLDIHSVDVSDAYAQIDAFSQNRLKTQPLGTTPRNMGKNDLWIAATAHVTDAILITADNDFDHLNKIYFDIVKIRI
jgi:tRNA(fMet)-specific endonuclease VapC